MDQRNTPYCRVIIFDQVKVFHSSKYYYGIVTAYYGRHFASHPIWFICETDELVGKGAEVLSKYSADGFRIKTDDKFTYSIVGDLYVSVQEHLKMKREGETHENWVVQEMEI